MTTLRFNNDKLHYQFYLTEPDNPTLFLLPDLYLDSGMWADFIRFASRRGFNLLTCDFYHRSGTCPVPSLGILATRLKGLLHVLQIRKVHLVGCRSGASLAVKLALLIREKIESMILMSLPLQPEQHRYLREQKQLLQLMHSDPVLFEKKYMMECIHPLTLAKARTIIHALRSDLERKNLFVLDEMLDQNNEENENLIGTLKKLQKPILFMHGEVDPVFPAPVMMIVTGNVAGSQSMIVPGASSLIPLDEPEFAAAQIDCFINKSDQKKVRFPDVDNKMIQSVRAMVNHVYSTHKVPHRDLVLSLMGGKAAVYWNGRELSGQWKKRNAIELLLFLIVNHGTAKRDTIIDAFTPETELSQARNRLRVQLSYLNNLMQKQPDPTVHDLLLIRRDSVTLNADVACDLALFIRNIEELSWSKKSAAARGKLFLNFLEDYHPDLLKDFHGVWFEKLDVEMKNRLSQTLGEILLDLKKSGNRTEMRRLLAKGISVEPYKGFCASWMDVLNHVGPAANRPVAK